MFDRLKTSLERFLPLTREEFVHFAALLTPRKLAKHEHFLRAGEVCTQIAFINQGCLRYYYLNDGDEFNGQFFFEGSWIGEYQSFLTGQPSIQYFDALEDSELLVMQHSDLQKIYTDLPKFERFGRVLAENVVIGSQRRTASLLFDTPEERYLKLIRERPKVVERIPLHHIASYLGIKPESLSRIRKRLAENR
ncbi:putative transcriptional regulator, Crp/Fnr family [Fibrisoma limi BUZ 3]|uniref:Putative transcriptional regulator, Crp/Fnr family n=1 Tax=Fibrisoma limi BUZ 3 TaxID=1185876 RepID=I2GCV3_9BACT|nr:Crp/Fnr family transcriptional regulator [Fibrisoma limi]CCH51727.1 putative transcriptional regulator, Crp/Fnr family [Fibrisoma limi BUZ 3]